jgi:hypothetical protein
MTEARDQKNKRPSGGEKEKAVANPRVVSLFPAAQPLSTF